MNGYEDLFAYYRDAFSLIDKFHFNSEVSENVFKSVLSDINGKVVPITHNCIHDNRKRKDFNHDKLKIGFIGSEAPFKGLPTLIRILQELNKNEKWEMSVWGGRVARHASLPIAYLGKFTSHEVKSVYDNMDVLVVPSIWKETFSLVTLEALSYGVPVIVSCNVGAQDIVKEYNPQFVYHTSEELLMLLLEIIENRFLLQDFNDAIIKHEWKHLMKEHAKEVIERIYE